MKLEQARLEVRRTAGDTIESDKDESTDAAGLETLYPSADNRSLQTTLADLRMGEYTLRIVDPEFDPPPHPVTIQVESVSTEFCARSGSGGGDGECRGYRWSTADTDGGFRIAVGSLAGGSFDLFERVAQQAHLESLVGCFADGGSFMWRMDASSPMGTALMNESSAID
ncbi:MAG: hypothetical protein R3C05_06505 [Pirellulaceae bacterium]